MTPTKKKLENYPPRATLHTHTSKSSRDRRRAPSMAIPRSAWRQFELSMLYAMVIATTGGVGFMIWGIKTGQIEKIDLDGISHQRADGRSKFAGEEPK